MPFKKIEPRKWRRPVVVDPTSRRPAPSWSGCGERFLYYVQPGGDALRYGVGIGVTPVPVVRPRQHPVRQEMADTDAAEEMIARKPELAEMGQRPAGRSRNPLGARALTSSRTAPTPAFACRDNPNGGQSAGAMSSGLCAHDQPEDVIDLYNRVNGKTPIVVG